MSTKGKILVVGSTNTDMVIQTKKFPAPGETILGGEFFMNPGGKGANQAVAAARLGGQVTFITKVGDDIFGKQSLENLRNENINVEYIQTDPKSPSGVALITVDGSGENSIVVAQGANGTLLPNNISELNSVFDEVDILLMQLEIPLETIEFFAKEAVERGIKVILNPAPANTLSDNLLANLYMITPNETEAEILTGVKVIDENSAKQAARILNAKGVEIVIITMGSKGAMLYSNSQSVLIPAQKVSPVDTTAAGDTFNGAIAVALSEEKELVEAILFANQAAAISVTRLGAQASVPFRNEIN
ncbi:ribokinase [Sunxiuqinia sp. A32]|uniref:ribokinase n=1 Tax=Sunxiuqinia sp. A32 TaxID=3461496 RepID=UPI00404528F4